MSQSFIRAFQLHEYTAMNHSVNICVAMYMHGRDKKKEKETTTPTLSINYVHSWVDIVVFLHIHYIIYVLLII